MNSDEQFKAIMDAIQAGREDTIVIKTKVENIEERAVEDRTKRDAQVTGIYTRLDTLSGDYRETKGEIDAHVADENRHQGAAPGSTARTVGYAGGGAVGVVAIIEAIKALAGG